MSSLNIILRESKQVNDDGIDKLICGCVRKDTHGLPCAQEIAELIRDGQQIPLYVVNLHWMKLDLMKNKVNKVSLEINIETEIESLRVCFVAYDEAAKLALKRKFKRIK